MVCPSPQLFILAMFLPAFRLLPDAAGQDLPPPNRAC
jgi:hypothetical protein